MIDLEKMKRLVNRVNSVSRSCTATTEVFPCNTQKCLLLLALILKVSQTTARSPHCLNQTTAIIGQKSLLTIFIFPFLFDLLYIRVLP